MSRATFESTPPEEKPTHWAGRGTGYVYWKIKGRWFGISPHGQAVELLNIDPVIEGWALEPRYGNLVITIRPED